MHIGAPQPKLLLRRFARREPSRRSSGPLPGDSVRWQAVGLILRYGDGRETVADQWHYFHQFERFDPKWLWGGIGIYLVGGLTAWLLALTVRPVGQTSSAG